MLQAAPLKNKQYSLFDGLFDANLISAFSMRLSGNMSLFYGDAGNVLGNRKVFLGELNIDYHRLVCAKQVHGSIARYICETDTGKGALLYENSISDSDALLTDKKNVPLAIFTADCLPVFVYDAKNQAIALVHAGWRSSKKNILAETIKLMQERFNSVSADLYAALGPAIRSCCYEVGPEFTGSFTAAYLPKRNGRYYLDLTGINKKQLLDSGVKDKNIFDPGICTFCRSEEFFSYRKEGPSAGRIMSVMMLK